MFHGAVSKSVEWGDQSSVGGFGGLPRTDNAMPGGTDDFYRIYNGPRISILTGNMHIYGAAGYPRCS